jgi:hypothetical protein
LLWLYHDVTNCVLTCALPACRLLLASCFLRFFLSGRTKGTGATRHGHRVALTAARNIQNSEDGAVCFAAENGARQRPSPGRRAKASSGERRGFAWIYIRTPPPSSLVLSPLSLPSPPAPTRSPSKRGTALPPLVALFFESLPLQTNKEQGEFSL